MSSVNFHKRALRERGLRIVVGQSPTLLPYCTGKLAFRPEGE